MTDSINKPPTTGVQIVGGRAALDIPGVSEPGQPTGGVQIVGGLPPIQEAGVKIVKREDATGQ